MKKLKIKILLIASLLSHASLMQGMFTQLSRLTTTYPRLALWRQREVLGNPMRQTFQQVRLASAQKSKQEQSKKSFWSLFSSTPVTSQQEIISLNEWKFPASGGMSAKGYVRSDPYTLSSVGRGVKPETSVLDKMRIYFFGDSEQKIKTPEEWWDKIGTSIPRFMHDKNDDGVLHLIFTSGDFEKIKKIVDQDTAFVNSIMRDNLTYDFQYNPVDNSYATHVDGTILDKLMSILMNRDFIVMEKSDVGRPFITEAIQYLMSKGAVLNSTNKLLYENAYTNYIMSSYRGIYDNKELPSLNLIISELEKMERLFKDLDPILEKLIPEFKDKLHEFQRERYFAKANIDEIVEQKQRQFFEEMRKFESERKNTNSDQQEYPEYQGEPIWKVLSKYGLTSTSSQQQIKKAYRAFAKEYRPDLPTEDKAKLKYIHEVNAARDAYNEQSKREQTVVE